MACNQLQINIEIGAISCMLPVMLFEHRKTLAHTCREYLTCLCSTYESFPRRSVVQHFEHGNAFEIRNGEMFNFYLGLPHVIMMYNSITITVGIFQHFHDSYWSAALLMEYILGSQGNQKHFVLVKYHRCYSLVTLQCFSCSTLCLSYGKGYVLPLT